MWIRAMASSIGACMVLALWLAAAQAAPAQLMMEDFRRYAFVMSQASPDVIVLDTRQDTVAARLTLNKVPRQLSLLEDAGLLLAVSGTADYVEVVDLNSGQTLAPIATGHRAEFLQYDPKNDVLAVAGTEAGSVSFVSMADRTVIARTRHLRHPTSMLFTPDGKHLLVASDKGQELSFIEAATGNIVQRLDVWHGDTRPASGSPGIAGLARTPNGWIGFAFPQSSDEPVSVLDLRGLAVLDLLALGQGPTQGFSTVDGATVIMLNNGDDSISLVSMVSRSEVARITGIPGMTYVSTGWFETSAFVASATQNKLLVVDLIDRDFVQDIALPGRPGTGATTPDGLKIYVPLTDREMISVIDVRTRSVESFIETGGKQPWSVQMASAISFCH